MHSDSTLATLHDALKTLERFGFDCQPSLDRKVVRELAGLGFTDRAENVVLLGPPGVGKTHLAIAFGIKAVEAGASVLFLTLETLMSRVIRARQENRPERTLQQFTYPGKVLSIHWFSRAVVGILLKQGRAPKHDDTDARQGLVREPSSFDPSLKFTFQEPIREAEGRLGLSHMGDNTPEGR